MIHFNDIENRKVAAAETAQALQGQLPQLPSVFEGSKQRVVRRMMGARDDGLYPGGYGRCKVSGGRCFWVLYVMCQPWQIYGFAESEQQAQTEAMQMVSEDFPTGVRFRFSAYCASSNYQRHFAKPSTFANDWRSRFLFWAERTHLYHYDYGYNDQYDEYQFDRPMEYTIAIVAVTEKKVFVHRLQKSQLSADDLKGITRQDCYSFDRLELETQGKAWHHKLFGTYHVERSLDVLNWQPPRQQTRPRIEELRRVMQKEHPDRGGNTELFMAAQKEYKQLRAILTNGERVAATGGRA